MKRTALRDLVVAFIAGATVGYLGQVVLTAFGARMLVPPLTFPATLVAVAILVFALAWPIRSALRGERRRPVNAIRASRIVVLAKASSASGAVLLGLACGWAIFALSRTVVPDGDVLLKHLAAVLAAGLVLTVGLVAERFCTLPPDDTEPEPSHG
ncbi:MAG TPA: DUF3180 domain-containing protein [Microbacteriaceae bacterium]|nr:DUF3180 domain-containing protein [Microbacteriaceae bacterium]